jgi:hypothetical protein
VLYSNLYGKNLEAMLGIAIKMKDKEAILIDVIILAKISIDENLYSLI